MAVCPLSQDKRPQADAGRLPDMRVFRRSDGRRSAADAVAQLRAASATHLREQSRAARRRAAFLLPLVIGVFLVNRYRMSLFDVDAPVRLACALALVGLGAWFARDLGRAIGPALTKRMDPGTAGTIGFLVRLMFLIAALVVALRIAGLTPRTLAVGGAVTAIVLGLAAQSTIGNVFAGLLILSVQPFRVGERVRLQAGGLAGVLEGTVTQLGLLYVTLTDGKDVILVPNNTVVSAAIVPLRQPGSIDVRARLRPGIKPSEVQRLIEETVQTPTRTPPEIELEEIDDAEVIMRITAVPETDADGPKLADEVLAAVDAATHATNGSS
jgi:small conductance mechanosensitive channel